MNILAIECSTITGGVALSRGGEVVAKEVWDRHSQHGEFVVPSIHKVLTEAGVDPEDIDFVAVDIGPGRFTGVRVAINAARTLAYSMKKPVVALTSLRILCEGCPKENLPVVAIINAHKNMVYTAVFENRNDEWIQTLEPQALTLDQLRDKITKPHLCVGDGYEAFEKFFDPELKTNLIRREGVDDHPNVELLSKISINAEKTDWTKVEPLYIRLSEAEERLKSRL